MITAFRIVFKSSLVHAYPLVARCELHPKQVDAATRHNGVAGLHEIVAVNSLYPFIGNRPAVVLVGRVITPSVTSSIFL
jgi:hypothetical protein